MKAFAVGLKYEDATKSTTLKNGQRITTNLKCKHGTRTRANGKTQTLVA